MTRFGSWCLLSGVIAVTFAAGSPKPGIIGALGIVLRLGIWFVFTFWVAFSEVNGKAKRK